MVNDHYLELVNLLRNAPEGLTAKDFQRKTDYSYATVLKRLAVCEALGYMESRRVGSAKVFTIKCPPKK